MPNHVDNDLTITGPQEDLEAFLKGIPPNEEEPSEMCSFIRVYFPMPVELQGTTSPARIESEEDKQHSSELIQLFGADNWYDWALQNWGTRWADYHTRLVSQESRRLMLNFNTAWSPPIPALLKISLKWPTLYFELSYYECGMAFQGTCQVNNGVKWVDESSDYNGDRGG